MYSIRKNRTGVIGIDSEGEERVLFCTSDVYRNKGQIPLHDLKKNQDGSASVIDIISDAILGRYEKYKTVMDTDTIAAGYLASDFLLADYIITRPDPLKVVLLDCYDTEKEIFHNSIGFFNKENLTIDISSSTRNEVFSRNGFDIVIISADDTKAEEQLRAAFYFLSKDGILLMISRDAPIFGKMAELFIQDVEKIRIDGKFELLISDGLNNYREWVKPVDLDKEFEKISLEVDEVKKLKTGGDMQRNYRELVININRLIKEAQSQWNLPKKQAFIDLKERLQRELLDGFF